MKSVAMQEQVKYCMSLFRNMTKKYQKRAKNSQKTALHETLKTNSTLLKVQSQDFFWWFWSTCIWNQYLCSKKVLRARVQMCPIMPKKGQKWLKNSLLEALKNKKHLLIDLVPRFFLLIPKNMHVKLVAMPLKVRYSLSLIGNIPKKCLKRAKNSQKILEKPKAPSKKSSPKICFVDSEAHQSKISCYLAKKIKQPSNKGWNMSKIAEMAQLANFGNF